MTQLIIRDLDDALLVRLKRQAWQQGLPLEESVRRLVVASVEKKPATIDNVVTPRAPRRKGGDGRDHTAAHMALCS